MKFKGIFAVLVMGLALSLTFTSCKKEKMEEETPYLDGGVIYDAPEFAEPGDVVTMVPSGGSHPEGKGIGYYWTATKILSKRDTTKFESDPATVDGHLQITIPDSLYTISVTCTMFAEGYASLTTTHYITVVTEESISDVPPVEGEAGFTDGRDGKSYTYLSREGLDWMNRNLGYASVGRPYAGCGMMTNLFGNLYTWDEAQNACPEGWRLPSEDEWLGICGGSFTKAAGSLMVDGHFNRDKMWEYWPDVKVSNSTGMNFLPTGYATGIGDEWESTGKNEYSLVWTSNEYDEEQATYIGVYVNKTDVFVGNAHKDSFAASVRCVREN